MENHTEDHENAKKELFEREQSILTQIYERGFAGYIESISNLSRAFNEKVRSVSCIDEGTPSGCFHSAGSGILRDKNEVIKYFKKLGVTEITSHDGCGAASLYAKDHNLELLKSDEYGKQFSKEIAQELGISYRHINADEMNRSKGQHVARVAYFDSTSRFNYSKVKELPSGFIISSEIQSLDNSIDDALISFKIATGGHGFGDLINEKNPFLICAISDSEEDLKNIKAKLSIFEKEYGSSVKIDGFLSPKIPEN